MISRARLVSLVEDLKLAKKERGSSAVSNLVTYSILPPLEAREDVLYPDWAVYRAVCFLAERKDGPGSSMSAYPLEEFLEPLWLLHELKVLLSQIGKGRFLANRSLQILEGELENATPLFHNHRGALKELRSVLTAVREGRPPAGLSSLSPAEGVRTALLRAEAEIQKAVQGELDEMLTGDVRREVKAVLKKEA